MKKILALICGIAALTIIVGCSSTHVSQYSAPLEVKLETTAVPTVEVGDEIGGEATIQRILFFKFGVSKFSDGVNYGGAEEGSGGFSLLGDTMAEVKGAAAYNACVTTGADVIIAPRYTIESTNYVVYQKTVCKVKGYKGVFKGLKK